MPIFYFDIVQINGTFTKDTVGVELKDLAAAKLEAKRCLAEMSEEAVNADLSELRIVVRNASGEQVALRVAHFQSDESEDS